MSSLKTQCNFSKMRSTSAETNEKNLGNVERILEIIEQEYGLQKIESIKMKHMERVFEVLQSRDLTSSTLAGYATAARMIAKQINKENIVPRTNKELQIERSHSDRYSPKNCNIEKQQEIRQALYDKAQYLGLAHDMREAFGLRAKESLMSNKIVVDAKGREYLKAECTKGGRPREIEIKTQAQREIIKKVNEYLRETGQRSLIPRDKTLKQGLTAQRHALELVGATKSDGSNAHALRHQYAQDRIAEGDARGQVAEDLGHGRAEVISHYVR